MTFRIFLVAGLLLMTVTSAAQAETLNSLAAQWQNIALTGITYDQCARENFISDTNNRAGNLVIAWIDQLPISYNNFPAGTTENQIRGTMHSAFASAEQNFAGRKAAMNPDICSRTQQVWTQLVQQFGG